MPIFNGFHNMIKHDKRKVSKPPLFSKTPATMT